MNPFKRITLTVIALLLCATVSSATEESHRKAAQRVLLASNTLQKLDQIIGQSEKMLDQVPSQMGVQPADSDLVRKYVGEMRDSIRSVILRVNIKEAFVTAYVAAFTESDLDQMATFLESPVGKRWTDSGPTMQLGLQEIIQKMTTESNQKVQLVAQRLGAELATRHQDTTATTK